MDSSRILGQREGILKFTPACVARVMLTPDKHLKLHPDGIFLIPLYSYAGSRRIHALVLDRIDEHCVLYNLQK